MRKKQKKQLFISFGFTNSEGIGFGNTMKYFIKGNITEKNIREIEDSIKKENNLNSVTILNYKLIH